MTRSLTLRASTACGLWRAAPFISPHLSYLWGGGWWGGCCQVASGFDELWLARLQAQPWRPTLPLVAEQGHLEAGPTPLCIESPAARSRDIPEVCGRDLRACCSRGIIRCRACSPATGRRALLHVLPSGPARMGQLRRHLKDSRLAKLPLVSDFPQRVHNDPQRPHFRQTVRSQGCVVTGAQHPVHTKAIL